MWSLYVILSPSLLPPLPSLPSPPPLPIRPSSLLLLSPHPLSLSPPLALFVTATMPMPTSSSRGGRSGGRGAGARREPGAGRHRRGVHPRARGLYLSSSSLLDYGQFRLIRLGLFRFGAFRRRSRTSRRKYRRCALIWTRLRSVNFGVSSAVCSNIRCSIFFCLNVTR